MHDYEQNEELVVVFSPVTDKKFVIDTRGKVIHLSTCPSLKTKDEENYMDIEHHPYQKCCLCLG